MHEGEAGFRWNRRCMNNVYTLNKVVKGTLKEDKLTYTFFLDLQKLTTLCGGMACGLNFVI